MASLFLYDPPAGGMGRRDWDAMLPTGYVGVNRDGARFVRSDGAPVSQGVVLVHRLPPEVEKAVCNFAKTADLLVIFLSGSPSPVDMLPRHVYRRQAPVALPGMVDLEFRHCFARFWTAFQAWGRPDFILLEPGPLPYLAAIRLLAPAQLALAESGEWPEIWSAVFSEDPAGLAPILQQEWAQVSPDTPFPTLLADFVANRPVGPPDPAWLTGVSALFAKQFWPGASRFWRHRSREFKHDWLVPKFLVVLRDVCADLEGNEPDQELLHDFLTLDFPQWPQATHQARWLLDSYISENTPCRHFARPPLCRVAPETKSWLAPQLEQAWLNEHDVISTLAGCKEALALAEASYTRLVALLQTNNHDLPPAQLAPLREHLLALHTACRRLSDHDHLKALER